MSDQEEDQDEASEEARTRITDLTQDPEAFALLNGHAPAPAPSSEPEPAAGASTH